MHLSADALSKILFPPHGIKERARNSMFYTKTSALLSRNCHTKKQTKKKETVILVCILHRPYCNYNMAFIQHRQ